VGAIYLDRKQFVPVDPHGPRRVDLRDDAALQLERRPPAQHPGSLRGHRGQPAGDAFEITTGHGRTAHGLFRVYPIEEIDRVLINGARVKTMRTRFQVLRRVDGATLLYAFPETGRTHQIRLHLAHLGHPLIGDARYGGPAMWRGEPALYHLLHAERMTLPHPRSHYPLELIAPAPAWGIQPRPCRARRCAAATAAAIGRAAP